MELKVDQGRRWLIMTTSLWMVLIMAIGTWWLYLIVNLSSQFPNGHPKMEKFLYMAKWEGLTFYFLFLLVSLALVFFYFQDLKRSNAFSSFFASPKTVKNSFDLSKGKV